MRNPSPEAAASRGRSVPRPSERSIMAVAKPEAASTPPSQMCIRDRSLGGEEILRLRIYEKLQGLVSAGGLVKKGREYTAQPKLITLKSETLDVYKRQR